VGLPNHWICSFIPANQEIDALIMESIKYLMSDQAVPTWH
jgi:hypothetical protein